MAEKQSIESLYHRYLANDLNDEELGDFLSRLHDPSNYETVSKMMDGTWKEMYEAPVQERARVIPLYRRTAFRWIAAASVILVMSYALWVTIGHRKQGAGGREQVAVHDVPAPSNTRAVITLADGSKVYLDSVNNGTIAQQNNVAVVKNAEGEISYKSQVASGREGEIAYNTLYNPRGSKVISLTLSDGTKVWLNSESSLRYPASFAPDSYRGSAVNREVQITGEAYFDVKHNSKQPFKVHLPNGSIVEDIGTAFNINAYADEADIKTTLIEGSVKVTGYRSQDALVLKPGEQSVINGTSQDHQITTSPDLDEVLAWKNGFFSFKGADITTVMRQLERWYDLQVVYNDVPREKFHVEMNRNTNLSNVFRILEETGGVHFKIEGKKVIVLK